MTNAPRGAGYGAGVGATLLCLLVLSGVALLVLFAPQASDRGVIYGDAATPDRAATATGEVGAPVGASPTARESTAAAEPVADSAAEPAVLGSTPPSATPVVDDLTLARGHAARRDWHLALRIYDRLRERRPGDVELAVERARVLAWSGDARGAADAMREVVYFLEATPESRLELARYLWWAGDAFTADAELSRILRLAPAEPTALSLREQIRAGADPSVELAREWLRSHPGATENLLLARALARAGRSAEAVPHYRAALATAVAADSLALEVASVATAADSLDLAATALRSFLGAHPADRDARLRLARVLQWSGQAEAARAEFRAVLQLGPELGVEFELARLDAWTGQPRRAQIALLRILEREPVHAPSLLLLGDLARWGGEWDTALDYYDRARAADPGLEGLDESVRHVERHRPSPAPRLASRSTWVVAIDGFGDSERFRWLSSRASRSWGEARAAWGVAVHQELWDGVVPAGPGGVGAGYGAELFASTRLGGSWSASAAAGARSVGGALDRPVWSLGLVRAEAAGGSLSLDYAHQPALRRVASLAALEAETVSDLLQLTLSRPAGPWHVWSRLELERLRSALGTTGRGSAALALSRQLGEGWSGFATLSTLAADEASPVLADWGPLYWSPEAYHAASLGVAFRSEAPEGWRLGGRLAPGYAWVREREGTDRRYARDRTAIFVTGFDASHRRGRWQLESAAEWSGTLGDGYRAAALRLQASFFPALP